MKRILKDYSLSLYIAKILIGSILGLILGVLRINPLTLIDKIIYIAIIIGVLVITTILVKAVLKINESLKKLLLLHGTFWYVVAILGFWTLLYNITA